MYRVVPDPLVPVHAPLTGWRAWLNHYLRVPELWFRRTAMVILMPSQRIVCHPSNVDKIKRFLDERNLRYVIDLPKPTAVSQPQ